MALEGIRLSDLYSSKDYTNWLSDSTNSRLVDYTIKQSPDSDPDKVRGHLYLNSKIKGAIGEEAFSKLPHMNLEEKLNWVNNNIQQSDDSSNEMEEPELAQPEIVQRDSVVPMLQQPQSEEVIRDETAFMVPQNGRTIRDWFRDNAGGGDYTAFRESLDKKRADALRSTAYDNDLAAGFGSRYKSENTARLEQELEALKESSPNNAVAIRLKENELKASRKKDDNAVNDAFAEIEQEERLQSTITDGREGYFAPIERSRWNKESTQRTLDELTGSLRERFDSDNTFAFDTFKTFEDEMIKNVPQYRNYHDTPALGFTPDEMKDIMAEYYAIRQLKDPNEAAQFASAIFQQRLAEKQALHEKAAIGIKMFGMDIVGNTAAVVGMVANSPYAIRNAIASDTDIEDTRGWKEFLYYSADNPLTRWGNKMITTGAWDPTLQNAYEEMQYNALQLQREPGKEGKFDIRNTPFEVFGQMGFTVAGMLTGTAAAQFLTSTVGKESAALATRMLAKEGAGKGTRIAAKAVNTLGKELVVAGSAYIPAAAEASMDAMETYQTSKDQASEAVLMGLKDQLEQEYYDGTYDMWYQRNSRIPFDLNVERSLSDEEREELAQLREQERAYLWNTYQTLRQQDVLNDPDIQNTIEMAAKRAAAKNMYDETTWIALGDYTIANTLGKAFKAAKQLSRRALLGENINNKFRWVPEGNHYRPVVKEITTLDKIKAVGKGFVEAGEEGFEELFQTVDSKIRQDLNKHMIAQYVENRYDPEEAAAVTDRMFKNWAVTKESFKENILSDEAIYSFGIGALSAGLGSPTIFRGAQTFGNTYAKTGNFKQALKEGVVASWRNPIAENLGELKTKQIESQQEANDLNRWISAHPEIDTLNDEAAILGFIDQQAQALKDGDEATYRDAVMGQQIATMLMYERVNPNGSKVNFYARLEQLSKLNAADPQARDVLNQVLNLRGDDEVERTEEGPLNEQEAAVIEDVKNKAQKLLNTYENLKAEIKVLDSQFGNSISQETKEALAYSLLMQNDWESRINSIHSKAVEAFNSANPDSQVAPISAEQQAGKDALAHYGTKENIEKEYQDLLKQRDALRKRRRSMYKYEYKAAFDKNQRAIRENRSASKALASLEDGTVITAEEILSLSNKDRAYILDEANRGNYSEAQQREITKFLSSEGIRGDMVTDLVDAGRLQAKKEYFKDEYEALMQHNGALIPIFDREIRKKASKTWTKAKLATAMEANTYDEFRDAMDKSLQTGEFTDADRMVMNEIFNEEGVDKKTFDFYQRFRKEEMTRRSLRSIIENSPEFKNLDDGQKAAVQGAVEQVQREGKEVNADSIIAKLADENYRAQLERQGIDVSALTNAKTFEELAQAIEKVMQQKKAYDQNAAALRAEADKKAKEAQNPSRTPKPEGKESRTAIPKKNYERDKKRADSIFEKIANNFSKRRKQQLTRDEYIAFANLYSDEPIIGDILVDELDTALTPDAMANNISKLETAVQNKLYTDENAKDSEEVKNTLKLAASLQGMLNTVSQLNKVGVQTSLDTLIKNSILEIRPDLKQTFTEREIKFGGSVKRVDGKAEKALTTETEKKWYADNKISDNLKTLMGIKASEVEYVFIKDSELENQLKQELNAELDDDDVPIIIAARVPLNTPGAVRGEDGYTYLYVGLLANSRIAPAAQERNEYNSLRNIAIDQEENGPIKYNGVTVTGKGPTPRMRARTQDKTETTSLRDWILDKYKDIKNPQERKQRAVKDFKDHYRRIKTTVKNGEVRGAYEWNGKTINISWATTAPDSDTEITRSAYIMENADGTVTPVFIEVKRIDEVDFDDTHTMYEMLNDPDIDITSSHYASNDGNYIRKTIVALTNLIVRNKGVLISGRARAKAEGELNGDVSTPGKIQQAIQKYLNLSKPANRQKAKISVGIQVEDGELQLICWETGTEDDKQSVYGIPMVLSRMSLSTLQDGNAGAVQEAVALFAKDAIKNLIYDEEGQLRTADTRGDGNQWPVIKFEDNYRKNDKDIEAVYDERDIELKLLGNIWQVRQYALKEEPEAVSVEVKNAGPTGPITPGTPNAQEEAIRRITAPEFIDEHEGEHYELGPNETEVTTFIKGGGDDIDWGDKTLAGQLATNLGTSVDRLYRVWRRNKTPESVTEYMRERGIGAWPGLSRLDIPRMLEQFKRIDKFFEERGEKQIDADLIFKGNVEYNGKYKYLVGKPDIITVDKNGMYHIYDMKSFRFQSGAIAKVPGFKSLFFTINGKRDIEKDMDKWRKQMSLYRAMIESRLGAGTVSTDIGVIPIRLGYSVEGSIDPYKVEGVGSNKINGADGKPMHLSFATAPMEKTPSGGQESITRCYDEPIKLSAIQKLDDINPDGWRRMDSATEMKKRLDVARGKSAPTVEGQTESTEPDLLENVSIPEFKGPVVMHKPLENSSKDELLKGLEEEGAIDEDELDQLVLNGSCNNFNL